VPEGAARWTALVVTVTKKAERYDLRFFNDGLGELRTPWSHIPEKRQQKYETLGLTEGTEGIPKKVRLILEVIINDIDDAVISTPRKENQGNTV
jgi:hypothetical protein